MIFKLLLFIAFFYQFVFSTHYLPFSDYQSFRYFNFYDKIYIFTNKGIFNYYNNVISFNNSFSSDFYTSKYSPNILKISNTIYSIIPINLDKIIIFSIFPNPKILNSYNLNNNILKIKDDNIYSRIKLGFLDNNILYSSYTDSDLYGNLLFINYNQQRIRNYNTLYKLNSNYHLRCEYMNIAFGLICIYSNEKKEIIAEIFSEFGRKDKVEIILDNINYNISSIDFKPILDINIQSQLELNEGSIVVIIQSYNNETEENTIYLYSFQLKLKEGKRVNFTLSSNKNINIKKHKIELIQSLNNSYSFFLSITNSSYYIIMDDLNYYSSQNLTEGYGLTYIPDYLNSTSLTEHSIIYYTLENNIIYKKLSHIKCKEKNLQISASSWVGTNFLIKNLIEYNFTLNKYGWSKEKTLLQSRFTYLKLLYNFGSLTCVYNDELNYEIYDDIISSSFSKDKNYEDCFLNSQNFGVILLQYIINDYENDKFSYPWNICNIIGKKKNPFEKTCSNFYYNFQKEDGNCVEIYENELYEKYTNSGLLYIENYIPMNMEEYYNSYIIDLYLRIPPLIYNDFLNHNLTSIILNGDDFSLYYYNPEEILNIQNQTLIELDNECYNILKNKLVDNESKKTKKKNKNLFIWQVDFNSGKNIFKTTYIILDYFGEPLDLVNCTEKGIIGYSLIPLNIEDYLEMGYSMLNHYDINIFNSSDKLYNDPCFKYEELTLKKKREKFYKTYNLCGENCTFKNVNFKQSKSYCSCDIQDNREEFIKNITYEDNSVNYKKRRKNDEIYNNTNNRGYLNNSVFPSNTKSSGFSLFKCYKNFFKNEIITKNSGLYIQLCLLFFYLILMANYFFNIYFHIKDNIRTLMNIVMTLRNKKYTNILNKRKTLDHNVNNTIKTILTDYSIISKFKNVKYGTKGSHLYKKVCKKYAYLIKTHHIILNLIFNPNTFIPSTLKFAFLLSIFQIIITFNALFYNEKYIEELIDNKETLIVNSFNYVIKNQIGKSIYAYLLSYPFIVLFFYLSQSFLKFEYFVKKLKNSQIEFYQKLNIANLKVFIFFILSFLLHLFDLFYCSIFCNLYPSTQGTLLIGSLYTGILHIFTPFITNLFLILLFIIGKKYNLTYVKEFVNLMT